MLTHQAQALRTLIRKSAEKAPGVQRWPKLRIFQSLVPLYLNEATWRGGASFTQ